MDLPIPDGPNKDMWLALIQHDNARLDGALFAGADPNYQDQQGLAPIMLAAFCDNVSAVERLAESGAWFPDSATGRTFDTYFDITPPWYEMFTSYTAAEIVAARGDLDTLNCLLALPNAAAVLEDNSASILRTAKHVGAEEFDLRPTRLMLGALFDNEWRGVPLSEMEADIARQVVFGLIPELLGEHDAVDFQMLRATEHVEDRGSNAVADQAAVHALSFTIEYAGAPHVDRFHSAEWDDIHVDVEEGHDSFKFGSWPISPNISARLSRQHTWRCKPGDEDGENVSQYLSGTVFFSEDPQRLEEYLETLGPDAAAGELLKALNPILMYRCHDMDDSTEGDRMFGAWDHDYAYERTAAALEAGADSSLSHFGAVPADARAIAASQLEAMRALIEWDPLTQHRLTKRKFTACSPLIALLTKLYGTSGKRSLGFHSDAPREGDYRGALRMLLKAGVLTDAKVARESSALCLASSYTRPWVLSMLLDAGADPSALSANGSRALVSACARGRSENAGRLIEAGADVNACDTGGRSALEAAALNKDEGLMAILLSAGASAQDVACRVREGKVKLNDRIASMLSAIAARTTMQSAMRRGALPASIRRV